jgi:hypothetical protein
VLLALLVSLVGRSSCQLGLPLGAPLSNLPCIVSRNSNFALHWSFHWSLSLSVLLVGHSSCVWAPILPCIASENPKFFSHHTCVASYFGYVGWVLLLPNRLAFGRPSCQLALHCLWKPQICLAFGKHQLFFPTTPVWLSLLVLLVGHFC